MIRIAICEDVQQELEYQRSLIESIMVKLFMQTRIYCFQSGEDLLCEMDVTGNMDIIFMDIKIKGIDGVETARRIRQRDTQAILIFISAYDQYCKELISVQPFEFLDKPIKADKLEQILKYAMQIRLNKQESYNFCYNKIQYKIPLSEIKYFQSDKRTIRINVANKNGESKDYIFYEKLEKVEEFLNDSNMQFLRVRKSYLVNPQYIVKYEANRIILDNGQHIEISRAYKEAIKQYYLLLLRKKQWE